MKNGKQIKCPKCGSEIGEVIAAINPDAPPTFYWQCRCNRLVDLKKWHDEQIRPKVSDKRD